eukprot:scaffold146355_cov17-Tisochrysis_lutea.AAC.1
MFGWQIRAAEGASRLQHVRGLIPARTEGGCAVRTCPTHPVVQKARGNSRSDQLSPVLRAATMVAAVAAVGSSMPAPWAAQQMRGALACNTF